MEELENTGLNIDKLKVYLFKGLRYWYVIAITLLIGIGFGIYEVRYNIPQYTVDGRVLVKDEYSSWGQEYFLPGMELVSGRNRLVNEIGIIKSYPLMLDVVKSIPALNISYYDLGQVKSTELYKSSPFEIEFDSIINKSLYNFRFYIKIIDQNNFLLSRDDFDKDLGTAYKFNQTLTYAQTPFKVVLKKFPKNITAKKFYFQFNNLEQMAKLYQHKVYIYPEDEESSILLLSLNGSNYKKEMDVLNQIMKSFLQYGLDEGNAIAENTIKFVNDRISISADSLNIAENNLKNFKEGANTNRLEIKNNNVIPQLTELENKKLELEFALDYYDLTIDYIKNNDDAKGLIIPFFLNNQSALYRLMVGLIDKYSERNKLKFSANEGTTTMLMIDDEINTSKQILIENLYSRKAKDENDLNIIKSQIALANKKLTQLPAAERDFTSAVRDYTIQNSLFTQLLSKRQAAEIALASSIPNAKILDHATPFRVRKTSPTSGAIYRKQILIFLILGILIIAVLVLLNNKIIDKNDITNITDIPILGYIGKNTIDSNLVLLSKPKSMMAEAFRTIRTNIQYLTRNK